MIAQEKEIAALELDIKKTKTVIKSLKTRKKNTEKEFVERQSELFNRGFRTIEESRKLNKEISDFLKKLAADKRFTEEERMMFSEMLAEYEVSAQLFEEQPIPEMDPEEVEEARAKARHFYKEFEVETSKEEKKNIRQLYLQLSREFHPDRITDAKQKARAKALQQKIIQAYEANDYQALLDIQAMHSEKILEEVVEGNVDILAARIKTLKQKLEQLIAQKERLSQELKAFRESDQGRTLSATKSAERQGYSFGEISGMDEMEEMLGEMKNIRNALAKSLEQGQVGPELAELLEPVEEDFPFFGDLVDDFFEEAHNPNPLFPKGTLVAVMRNFTDIKEWDAYFPMYGTVDKALLDPYGDGEPVYNIRLHSESLYQLPPAFFHDQLEFEDPIDYLTEVYEIYLVPTTAVKPEPPAQQVESSKKVWIDTFLRGKMDKAYLHTIEKALFSYKDASVAICWKKYLQQHISLPRPVRAAVPLAGMWEKGETFRWIQIEDMEHPDFPVLIRIESLDGRYAVVPPKLFEVEEKAIAHLLECNRLIEALELAF